MSKSRSLCRPLNFDQAATFSHHHIHVAIRAGILRVIQVSYWHPVPHPDRHGRNEVPQRIRLKLPGPLKRVQRIDNRNACSEIAAVRVPPSA